jgi:hypothetical protein
MDTDIVDVHFTRPSAMDMDKAAADTHSETATVTLTSRSGSGRGEVNPSVVDDQDVVPFTVAELLQRADELRESRQDRAAAQVYMCCVQRLHDVPHSEMLAQALRGLAQVYEANDQFELAVRFRDAERMVYESRLLHLTCGNDNDQTAANGVSHAQHNESDATATNSVSESGSLSGAHVVEPNVDRPTVNSTASNDELISLDERKAEAFEKLAQLFFERKQVEMAKSYALKAIDLRRKRSMFGSAKRFADLGREQYEATLREIGLADLVVEHEYAPEYEHAHGRKTGMLLSSNEPSPTSSIAMSDSTFTSAAALSASTVHGEPYLPEDFADLDEVDFSFDDKSEIGDVSHETASATTLADDTLSTLATDKNELHKESHPAAELAYASVNELSSSTSSTHSNSKILHFSRVVAVAVIVLAIAVSVLKSSDNSMFRFM